jgi:hypothetical protein
MRMRWVFMDFDRDRPIVSIISSSGSLISDESCILLYQNIQQSLQQFLFLLLVILLPGWKQTFFAFGLKLASFITELLVCILLSQSLGLAKPQKALHLFRQTLSMIFYSN